MDIATKCTKKKRTMSQDMAINQEDQESTSISKQSDLKARVLQQYKATSLPFHQFYPQTYSAFQTPLNSKSLQGSSAYSNGSYLKGGSSNLEKEQLDALYETLNKFYQSEKNNQKLKQMQVYEANRFLQEKNQAQKINQSYQLKQHLEQQILDKSQALQLKKLQQLASDKQALQKFQTLDTNVVSVFPKITETPKHIAEFQNRQIQSLYNSELQEQMRQNKQIQELEKQRDETQARQQIEHQTLMRNQNDKKLNDMRQKYQEKAIHEWEANLKAKSLQQKVKTDADKLQYDIIYGKMRRQQQQTNFVEKVIAEEKSEDTQSVKNQQNSIMNEIGFNSLNDGNRFQNHNKKNLTSCNFLGSQPFTKTPRSMYQEQYFNSSAGFINRKSLNNSIDKLQDIGEEGLAQDKKVQNQIQDLENRTSVYEEVIEEEGETIAQEEDILNNTKDLEQTQQDHQQLTQRIDGDRNEDAKGTHLEELKSTYSKELANRSRMNQSSYGSKTNRLSKLNLDKLSNTLTQGNYNLPSVSKTNRKLVSETASTISSRIVQQKVRQFTQQIIPPSLAKQGVGLEQQLDPLQFDALKRFIKQLEEEAIQVKRTAKEAREQNSNFDNRIKEEENHNNQIRDNFRKNILTQIKQNHLLKKEYKEIEISKPHIEGNEGYPPRPEPTKEEAIKNKRIQQKITKINLEQQIQDKDLLNRTTSHFYRSEYNKDMFESEKLQNQESLETRAKSLIRKRELNDIWSKTIKIAELKQKFQQELGISFNDDKILKMIQYSSNGAKEEGKILHLDELREAKQKQEKLNDPNIIQTHTPLVLTKRKQTATTAGSLMNSFNNFQIQDSDLQNKNRSNNNSVIKQRPQDFEEIRSFQQRIQSKIEENNQHNLSQRFQSQGRKQKFIPNQLGEKRINPNRSIIEDLNQSSPLKQGEQRAPEKKTLNTERYPWEDRQASKQQIREIFTNKGKVQSQL